MEHTVSVEEDTGCAGVFIGHFGLLFKGIPRVVVESGLRDCGKSGKDFRPGEF